MLSNPFFLAEMGNNALRGGQASPQRVVSHPPGKQ